MVELPAEAMAELSLLEEGALLRAILDNIAEALLTFDEAGRAAACNPAAERLFGYRASEVIGQPLAMLLSEAYPGEPVLGMVRPQQPNAPGRRSGADRNADFRHDRTCRRRDGSLFPAELHVGAMPLWKSSGMSPACATSASNVRPRSRWPSSPPACASRRN